MCNAGFLLPFFQYMLSFSANPGFCAALLLQIAGFFVVSRGLAKIHL